MWNHSVKRVLAAQALLTLATTAAAWLAFTAAAAAGALYGGATALAVTLLGAWRLTRISGARGGLLHLYLGLAERYGLAIALLTIAFTLTPLPAAAAVTGFAIAQLGAPVAGVRRG